MTYGLENAMEKVREAASQGAQIIQALNLFIRHSVRHTLISVLELSIAI
jgi:hypothetical protein